MYCDLVKGCFVLKKRKRSFTIMIIPHSEEATCSVRLPLIVGQIVVAVLAVCLAGVLLLAFSYRNTLVDAREARALREVNQVLQDEINEFAFQTQQLLDLMGGIEDLAEHVADRLGIKLDEDENESEGDVSALEEEDPQDRITAARSGDSSVLDRTAGNIAVLQELLPEREDSLEMLKGEVDEHLRRLAATPTGWPTRGYFTSGFGMRRDPLNRSAYKFHYGVDIAGAHGTAVWATADGVISSASYRGGYGNLVIIDHGYGFVTYYAHLSRFAVSSGQQVRRGQVIGYMGRTGRVTGTHLHYEVHVNGTPVNPLNYM